MGQCTNLLLELNFCFICNVLWLYKLFVEFEVSEVLIFLCGLESFVKHDIIHENVTILI